ncbi:hypothetical protein B0H14DRAFT_2709399 [Mycena olivaceomarginata]|nr:hypothetical protein B0H14DRAFT_2709399 [Mycena olivaceomarginata]
MLQWKEFEAWVCIEGEETVEYDVQTSEDDRTVTCWIASELGKKFSIHWKNKAFLQDVGGSVKVDGNPCGGTISYAWRDLGRTISKSGIADAATLKPFVFSSLEVTDDDDDALISSSSSALQDLGLLELTIYPVRINGELESTVFSRLNLSDLKVHERSKKAVTQQIKLAEPQPLEKAPRVLDIERTGPEVVKFCFKYRPIDVLRANGIAPSPLRLKRKASAEPPRGPTTDDLEELADLEEAKNLRRWKKKLHKRDKKPRIKDEDGDVIDLTQNGARNKRVKVEADRPFISGEVIDLT